MSLTWIYRECFQGPCPHCQPITDWYWFGILVGAGADLLPSTGFKIWCIKQTRINKLGKYPHNRKGSRSPPTRIPNQHQSVMGWQWGQGPWKHSPYIQVSDVLCYKPIPMM